MTKSWKPSFKRSKKGEGDAEINLVPFIDLLSVCICFMLLTAVWIQAGVLETKQGLGTEAAAKADDKSLWVEIDGDDLLVSVGGGKSKKRVSLKDLEDYATEMRKNKPEMNTALLLPSTASNYSTLIKAMNSLKKAEFRDVGIAPL